MTSEKIAIIHTGFHKAASSSIQHTLAHNRSLLEAHGYHYPDISIRGIRFYNCSVPLYGRYCEDPDSFQHYWYHNDLTASAANEEIETLFQRELWKKKKLVFSDEFVSALSEPELVSLRDDFYTHGYKVRLISYVRDPFSRIVSSAQQKARKVSVRKVLDAKSISKEVVKIRQLMAVFKSNAEFYNFESVCRHAAGPAGFFFGLINIDLPPEMALRVNEGMSLQAVRLLSFINEASPQLVGPKKINPIRKRLDIALLSKIKGEKFQLSSQEVAKIKPEILATRQDIAAVLGEDFLLPVGFSFIDNAIWGNEQLDYILKISGSLDLHLLLRVYDFLLNTDIQGESARAQRDKLALHIRGRLDRELLLRGRVTDMQYLAKRWRLYGLAKYLRSLFSSN